METDLDTSCKKKLDNRTVFVKKPKRIRKLRPGVCKYCNKWFADGRHLYAHIRIHTGEKPFVCNVCNRAFNQSSNLRRHLVIHNPTERTPFNCNVCERQFLDKDHFKEHVRAHDGIKPYSCPICSKRYSFKGSLKRHLPRHENEKRFICRICEEGFPYDHLLKYHMRIHNTKEKSYECTLCKRVFSRSVRFHSHLMTIHNIKIAFQCTTCNKRYPDKKTLEIHYLNHKIGKCSETLQEKLETRNKSKQCFENDINKNSDLYIKHLSDEKSSEKHNLNHKEDKDSEISQEKLETRNESMQCFVNDIKKSTDFSEIFNQLYEDDKIKTEPEVNFEGDTTKNKCSTEVSSVSQTEFEETEVEIKTEPEQDLNNSVTSRYFCGICFNEINSDTNIQEHLRTHTKQYIFVCYKCKKCFDSKSLFNQHTCSSDTKELFQCYICEETFLCKENFRKHLFKHTQEETTYC